MIGWLVDERGIEPHVKLMDKSERTDGTFSRSDFAFDPEGNLYVCPAGKELKKYHRSFPKPRDGLTKDGTMIYFARKQDCHACPLKPRCCPNTPARKIARSVHEAARDKARAIAKTEAYAVSCRERKKVEMLFAHLKRILRLGRLRLRGPSGAKDEFLLAATPKICGDWRNSSPSRSRPSPCEAKRRRFASLAAAAHEHRARLKTGFFNEIDREHPPAEAGRPVPAVDVVSGCRQPLRSLKEHARGNARASWLAWFSAGRRCRRCSPPHPIREASTDIPASPRCHRRRAARR